MKKILDKAWFLVGAMLIILIASCNPIKQMESKIKSDEKLKGDLAKLCSTQFPVLPSIQLVPGQIDTAGLLKYLYGVGTGQFSTTPGIAAPFVPVNPGRSEGDLSDNKKAEEPKAMSTTQSPANRISQDSLINALKRFIKPDKEIITKIDSAKVKALEYFLKNAEDSLAPLRKDNADLKLKLAISEGKATTRLWILIGIIALTIVLLYFFIKVKLAGTVVSTAAKIV